MFLSGLLPALHRTSRFWWACIHIHKHSHCAIDPWTQQRWTAHPPHRLINNSFAVYEISLFIVISGLVVCTTLGCCCYLFFYWLISSPAHTWQGRVGVLHCMKLQDFLSSENQVKMPISNGICIHVLLSVKVLAGWCKYLWTLLSSSKLSTCGFIIS